MNAYETIQDLYNFEEMEVFQPELTTQKVEIDGNTFTGYSFTTPNGLSVVAYRTEGTMGNHWKLYSLLDNKNLISGRKTRKQIIEDAGGY